MLLTYALVIAMTTQACTIGCLKCSTTDVCSLCDITNNYYLKDGACKVANITNCLLIDSEGTCLMCKPSFYIKDKKCVAITTAKKVDNCEYYRDETTCSACLPNFYMESGKCVAPETTITNCEDYATKATCSDCKEGYFVSVDMKSCQTVPSTSNCATFSRYQCKTCNSGYLYNRNLYFTTAF